MYHFKRLYHQQTNEPVVQLGSSPHPRLLKCEAGYGDRLLTQPNNYSRCLASRRVKSSKLLFLLFVLLLTQPNTYSRCLASTPLFLLFFFRSSLSCFANLKRGHCLYLLTRITSQFTAFKRSVALSGDARKREHRERE